MGDNIVERAAAAIEAEAVGSVNGDRLRGFLRLPGVASSDVLYLFAPFSDERDARRNWAPVVKATLKAEGPVEVEEQVRGIRRAATGIPHPQEPYSPEPPKERT